MNIRPLAVALVTAVLAGLPCVAAAEGLASISSVPATSASTAPSATGAIAAPVGLEGAAAATLGAVTDPAIQPVPVVAPEAASSDAADVPQSPVTSAPPPEAAPLAFTSVSSLNDSGGGPSLGQTGFAMADRIVVEKGTRRLYLMSRGRVIAEYPVKLGLSPKGHKQYEGDFRTPEGVYHLSRRNARSEFFLSVEVSYPNAIDEAVARREGLRPGGAIMIHGQPNVPRRPREYYATNDWTDGCIAVSNSAMVDIWQRTRVGIPIEIRP